MDLIKRYPGRSLNRLGKDNTAVVLTLQFSLGVFYGLGFAPLGWWPVALGALTGHLIVLQRPDNVYVSSVGGWMFGIGFFAISLHWIQESFAFGPVALRSLGWGAVLGLGLALGLFNGMFALSAHWLRPKDILRPLMLAALWISMEWLRSSVLSGFPWNLAAYVWSNVLPMLQATAYVGVYGLGFLTILSCATFAQLFIAASYRRAPLIALSAVIVMLMAAIYIGGIRRLEASAALSTQFRVRLVQANISQGRKWDTRERERIFADYLEATARAENVPSVVVWPETAVPFLLDEEPARRAFATKALPPDGYLVTGGLRREIYESGERRFFNSVLAITARGAVTGRYDKVHLVPFGEFVPLASLNPFPRLTAGLSDFTAGSSHSALNLGKGVVVAPLICYEAIFPGDLRALASEATVLVNVTNDAWFGMSWGPYQHLAMARVRAIELGLPLVRAANTGISAVFDPLGRSLAEIPLGARAYADVDVPSPLPHRTVYSQVGEWPLFAFFSFVLAIGAVGQLRQRWSTPAALTTNRSD